MNGSIGYLISIVVAVTAVTCVIVAAQEGNHAILNSITPKEIGLNLAAENNTFLGNNTVLNTANTKIIDLENNHTMVDPINGPGFNVSDNSPKVTAFIIDGFARPTKEAIYKNQSLLNAACLSRSVEGTPHGYVTYYN